MGKLKQLRESAGLTQKELAEMASVSIRNIQHYEQGQKDINKAQAIAIYKIANALNVPMESILDIKKEGGE